MCVYVCVRVYASVYLYTAKSGSSQAMAAMLLPFSGTL